jgi:Zn-finger nucleic acid-binding protein
MNKVYCGENGDVLIDECKKIHGLWFDGGELQKILIEGKWDKDNRIIDFLKDMFKSSIVEEQQ